MIVTSQLIKKIYRKRNPFAHKGDFGKLLVIGGSKTYRGSPTLVGLAAYRSGADWVTLFTPEPSANAAANISPNLIIYGVSGYCLTSKHLEEALELAKKHDAIVIGNGLGRGKETQKFIVNLLQNLSNPCVIDADAIHAVAQHKSILKKNFVLTPHEREFYIFTGDYPQKNLEKRKTQAKKFSGGFTVLLKGHFDIISDGKQIAVNKTGNPYMTVAGTGDTLAGIVGALLARGTKPFEAACAAAFINGKAGDLAAKEWGEGLMASDLPDYIPGAIGIQTHHNYLIGR